MKSLSNDFSERSCTPFNDGSYAQFSHSDVWDHASHSDDSLGPPVSLNDGFDMLAVFYMFKNVFKMFRMLEIISALNKPFVKLI